MTAGPEGSVVNNIADMVLQTFIPVLHQAAQDEAAKNLAGLLYFRYRFKFLSTVEWVGWVGIVDMEMGQQWIGSSGNG
jgi:hypothetical protein